MKCVVFGSGGYIGRHLVGALRLAGHSVTLPMHADGGRLDLRDAKVLEAVDWNVDCVFMFAGVTGTTASFARAGEFVMGNEGVLLNVLDAIRRSPHRPRVVFPSSRLVYQGADHPLREDAAQEAKTVYAANKIACELLLKAYGNAFDLPYTVLRICVPYGNRLGSSYSHGTLGNFIQQATQHGRINLYGDGSVRRSFSHIDDLCEMVMHAGVSPACAGQVFNLPGDDHSLREAATLVAERLGAAVQCLDWPALDLKIESGSTVFDASRWLAATGLAPRQTLAGWAQGIHGTQVAVG